MVIHTYDWRGELTRIVTLLTPDKTLKIRYPATNAESTVWVSSLWDLMEMWTEEGRVVVLPL